MPTRSAKSAEVQGFPFSVSSSAISAAIRLRNGYGERRKPLAAYDALAEKVYAQVLAAGAVRAEKGRGIAGNETADLRDRLFDKVKDLLEEYERAVFRERLFTLAGAL